ncbi:DMT family transporter [Streptomyces sp. NPDC092369]|uniref:DMT family transporter n=1 Tax=Streptomyces sp. NPDC092369 TaxID=3366015 RepID=UPI0038066303
MALFGTAFTSSKVVIGQIPHEVAAALRFGGGALVLLLLLSLRPGSVTFAWRDLVRAGSVGLMGVFAYNFFFFWGISLAPAIDGSIIVPVLSPVLTTITLLMTGHEKTSTIQAAGLALGVTGAVVFFIGIGGTGKGVTGSRLAGDFVFLLAAGCWAAYSITSKKVLSGMEPLRATAYATGVGALALTVAAIPSVPRTDWAAVPAATWTNVGFLAVGPTAVAYLFYNQGLRSVSPITATLSMFAVPVFGAVSSVLFLGESITAVQLAGALITIVGAALAVTRGKSTRDAPSG